MNQELMTLDSWQGAVICRRLQALSNVAYAKGDYEKEMRQAALKTKALTVI